MVEGSSPGKFRFKFQSDLRLDALAVLVGIAGGLAGASFRYAVNWIDELIFGETGVVASLNEIGGWPLLALATLSITTLGGLTVGYFVFKVSPESKGHGIPTVLEAMYLKKGRIPPRTPAAKFSLSILAIGTGASAGAEGPIAQVGAGLGSVLGTRLKLKPGEINVLIAAGGGAGIAAVFHAPMGGALFGMEILLVAISLHAAIPVLIASVTSVALIIILFGDQGSVFEVPPYQIGSPLDFLYIIILGLLVGALAAGWQYSLSSSETFFDEKLHLWPPLKTAIGAALTGLLLIGFSFDLRGSGYQVIQKALAADFSSWKAQGLALGIFLVLLALLKIAATSLSLGSGTSGGIFAPSLFMGATFGAGFSIILNSLFGLHLNPGLYAVLGMSALCAASTRAPLTMIVITLEMSREYSLLPGLMLAAVVSLLVHHKLQEESIYTDKLATKGVTSHARTADELLNFIGIEEIMQTVPVAILEDVDAKSLTDIFLAYKQNGYPVVNKRGRLVGIITTADVRRAVVEGGLENKRVKDIMTKDVVCAWPGMSVKEAIDMMYQYDVGRLPVVHEDENNEKILLGIFTRSDVIRCLESYEHFLEEKRAIVQEAHRMKVDKPMTELIPSKFPHLRNKVVYVFRDLVAEAIEYSKKLKDKDASSLRPEDFQL